MPIVMRLKDRRSCPTVVCDVCGKEIKAASDGNAQWMMDEEQHDSGATLYFTHKKCCHAFDVAHSDEQLVGANDLDQFMVFLSNNLHMNWEKAKKNAALIASIE
jgi:hypothetical protein